MDEERLNRIEAKIDAINKAALGLGDANVKAINMIIELQARTAAESTLLLVLMHSQLLAPHIAGLRDQATAALDQQLFLQIPDAAIEASGTWLRAMLPCSRAGESLI